MRTDDDVAVWFCVLGSLAFYSFNAGGDLSGLNKQHSNGEFSNDGYPREGTLLPDCMSCYSLISITFFLH
ncbi:hypothetical protein SDJN02_05381, partial [Cucurbita argyrosperma subsp. argyrosperma]